MIRSKKILFLSAALAVFALASCKKTEDNPVLSVTGGKIQGMLTDSSNVMVFKGIPYAAPPVGDLRWKAPQPPVPWEGVKVCDKFGPISLQPGNSPETFYGKEFYWNGTPAQSEDCLYLNVWAPKASLGNTDAKLPVALWIHGGAYTNGYGYEVTMDGDEWARRGVILVTINYRLGLLGFLSHPSLSAENGGKSGNYGFLDQVAALRWVSDNISVFGGDPSNITVFGQSAGAMSVKTLCASPLSKDRIAKAIIQSGGGVGGESLLPEIEPSAFDALGKDIMDAGGLSDIEKMRSASYEDLMKAYGAYLKEHGGWMMLGPHTSPGILPESFDAAVYDGSVADIPYMIGYNKDDIPALGGESVDRFCAVRDSLSSKPVYEYEFLRNLPGDDDDPEKDSGAFHSAELWYTFHTLGNSWRPFTKEDYALSDEMVLAWTDFCKKGDPGWKAFTRKNSEEPFKKEFDIKK